MLKGQARAEKSTQRLLARQTNRTDKEKAEKAREVRERGLKNRGITYNE